MAEIQVMLLAIDDSEHSFYALEWTLDHFITPAKSVFKLIVLHVKNNPSSVLGVGGPGIAIHDLALVHVSLTQFASNEVLPLVEADLKRTAEKTIKKAKDVCAKKSIDKVQFEVIEGDPRNALCDAVEKYHGSVLVLGSHGYGVIKRAFLGSVSDYCSHHAHCSVMIVKKHKAEHHHQTILNNY